MRFPLLIVTSAFFLACVGTANPVNVFAQSSPPVSPPPSVQPQTQPPARSVQQTQTPESQPARTGQTQGAQGAAVDENLPWLPGLGQGGKTNPQQSQVAPRPNMQPAIDPRLVQPIRSVQPAQFAQPYVPGQPQPGQPIAGARPIPNAGAYTSTIPTQAEPKSVLTNLQELTNTPMNNETPATSEAPIQVASETGSFPVVPAAFIDETETPSEPSTSGQENQNPGGNAGDTSSANQDVVGSQITKVTQGIKQLPNSAGQVWRTYDISPYTHSVKTTVRPEQAVVDWVLKETGTELWFNQPMGILSATTDELHVYHTPVIQNRIKPIIDRFVQSRGQQLVVGMRLMTIGSPGWRSKAFSMMQHIPVNSPGVEAWLMTKENAAFLGNQLRNRADYQERSNHDMIVANGQQYEMSKTQPVKFIRSLSIVNRGYPQYQPVSDQIDQGYTLEFSALSSLDGKSIEAIVGFEINQIEAMQRVRIDLPTASGQTQPFDLQIPQMVSWNVRERFRWPSDMVLVLSCGVVATPGPQRQALLGIPSLLNGSQGRADALMFIEYKGAAQKLIANGANGQTPQTATVVPAGTSQQGGQPAAPQQRR